MKWVGNCLLVAHVKRVPASVTSSRNFTDKENGARMQRSVAEIPCKINISRKF